MTITANRGDSESTQKRVTYSHLDDAGAPAAASINPGFTPRYVRVDNVTDRILWEWYEGMVATQYVQTVAAGTRTLVTGAGPTVTVQGGATAAQANVAFPVLQNKQYRVQIDA